jgi:hypothetical protein
LNSDEKSVVLNAVDRLKELGHSSLIPSVIKAWKRHPEMEIRQPIEKLLCSLKDTAALPEIIRWLNNENDVKLRTMLLTAIWQSGLNAKSYGNELLKYIERFGPEELIEITSIIDVSEGLDVDDDMRRKLERLTQSEKDQFRRTLMTDIKEGL